MQLFTSERFQKEYQEFSRVLAEIDHHETKQRLDSLLNQLVREVKSIDARHEDMIMQKKLPAMVGDSRNNLLETRKKIDRVIRDWRASR